MKNLTKQKMNQVKGFTLIELVVVIVILGILAATAAPKFIDLTSDARKSVMGGVKGSIESAVSLVQSRALIDGETDATGEVEIGTKFYALVYGYPAAKSAGTGAGTTGNGLGITSLVDLDSSLEGDFIVTDATPALFQHRTATTAANCQLSYADALNKEARPEITETLTGC